MAGINKVILIGYLDNEPGWLGEKHDKLFSFQLRIETPFLKDGKKSDHVDIHTIILKENIADTASRVVTKGKLIYVEGKASTNLFIGDDGIKRYKSAIVAGYFKILGRPGDLK
ncbi:single-stranded DNA-binding protein [Mucilaginibacter sp. UR6-1]|uniref:single-stranded DNA-binding protein n=1 Tax=Mucilaginibacter sp. UR6-1 TaxID=1435643 RepID=UPI001E3D4FD4|nr:single-stranded DNA-binding protein [Mucilaginibacter sp. UR6-1]MCC8408233.1 single-stranded DNA-binding protein [Mucilaginibacter sp. UR6-1]